MKYIIKGEEPKAFIDWKNKANDDWKPNFDLLSGDEKKAVTTALKADQGFICCYCERKLEENDHHIEHLKPKDKNKFPELQLEYSNLLCSCQLRLKKAEPRFCGNSKDNWYDERLFISPLDPECEGKFIYTYDGQINASSDKDIAAVTTIEKLNLNIDKLNALRQKAIEPFIEGLSEPESRNFAIRYLVDKENNNGRFNEFYTTIKFLFAQ